MFKYIERVRERIQSKVQKNSSFTLNRKNIYILPTKFGLVYIGMCFVLLIMAINFENALVYIFLFWLVSIFLTAMFLTWINLDKLYIRGEHTSPIFAGDEAVFPFMIESLQKKHVGIWLICGQSYNSVDCGSKNSASTFLSVAETKRGKIVLPLITIQTTFPLGIFKAWSYVDLNQSVICYPKPIYTEFQHTAIINDEEHDFLDNSNTKVQGVDNFDELKNYQVGDSLSRIDWKAYAKGHGLLVKLFSQQASKEIWLNESDFQGTLEQKMSAMCYWILEYSKENVKFGLVLANKKVVPAMGDEHRQKCLEILALYRTVYE